MGVLVAVDVGGSGLRSVISVDGCRQELRTDTGARIGPDGLDVTALVAATAAALTALTADRVIDVLVFGARGIVALGNPTDLLIRLRALGARRTVVCSDAVTSLVGATGGLGPGAVVAAGTGAVAFGSDFDRHYRRVDGWGHVLGDRGSAAWISLQVLRSLLHARDTGAAVPELPLGPQALDYFSSAESWPRAVLTRRDAPELLAGFAPVVTAAVDTEPLAARICRQAGGHLAESLLAAAAGLGEAAVLCYTGGVFGADAVLAAFEQAIAEAGAWVSRPMGDALDGAMLIAEQLTGHQLSPYPPYLLLG